MPRKLASSFSSALFILVLSAASSLATEPAAKKLQVFILAGQSNMVGHAHYITLPALLKAKEPDPASHSQDCIRALFPRNQSRWMLRPECLPRALVADKF